MATTRQIKKAKKKVRNLNRTINRSNAAFDKMSPDEKRVQLAKDVIDQIETKRLIGEEGTWLEITPAAARKVGFALDQELQDVFKKVKRCTGCAIGGLLKCTVERTNKFKVQELSQYQTLKPEEMLKQNLAVRADYYREGPIHLEPDVDAVPYLKRYFTKRQLELIEAAFEGTTHSNLSRSSHSDYTEEWHFIENPSKRLVALMENIIRNEGKFIPKDFPEPVRKQAKKHAGELGYDPTFYD